MEFKMRFVSRQEVTKTASDLGENRGRPAMRLSEKADNLLKTIGGEYMTLEEVVQSSGMAHMSVLSLIQVLRKRGMIVKRKRSSEYRLSFRGRIYTQKYL